MPAIPRTMFLAAKRMMEDTTKVLTCVFGVNVGRVYACTWHDDFVAEMRRSPRSAGSFCCRRRCGHVHNSAENSFVGQSRTSCET